ncbi:MAG: hypothetical protein ACK4GN_04985 [Runella sp.]
MFKNIVFILVLIFWGAISATAQSQVERLLLRTLITLRQPSPDKIYRITDTNKQGDWQYDPTDDSPPNEGTILASSRRDVPGRFRRIYDPNEGVEIEWFLRGAGTINEALLGAVSASEKVNFGAKVYEIAPLSITARNLLNRQRLHLHFRNTTLRTQNKQTKARILQISDVAQLTFSGVLTLDGNTSQQKITNPLGQAGEAFLHIVAPTNRQGSFLKMGRITFTNMPMCSMNIFTHNDQQDIGYERIEAMAWREINGFNGLNVQRRDFPIWGVNVRGAHRVVAIDSLYARQDRAVWGDAPIEKPFYTFTFENQADPRANKRKDSVYIKNLYAEYPCAMILYTQAPNHVLVENYVMRNVLRKPNVPDARAYPTMLRTGVSWVGSKHTWTSYHSPNSSFRIKKMLIENTNPLFMNESAINDITGLWLNKGMVGAILDSVATDVRLKLYGDGHYFGMTDVEDGRHEIGYFMCKIPSKRNYVQPLNADLTVRHLHIARESGVTFTMENARLRRITQEEGSKVVFESRPNRFKDTATRHNGFIVEACQATNITWRFSWYIMSQDFLNIEKVNQGERYEFRNFSGNNFLQTSTTFTLPNGTSTYVSAFRYDGDANVRSGVQRFLQFVEFDWTNVTFRLTDISPSDFAQRLWPLPSNRASLATVRRVGQSRGWKRPWQESRFVECRFVVDSSQR